MSRGFAPAAADLRLPDGFVVTLDGGARVYGEGAVLLGGRPRRMLLLHPSVRAKLVDRSLVVRDSRTAVVARRLLDAGLAHPLFLTGEPPTSAAADLDIVIPVRDRTRQLRRLLAAIRADPETSEAHMIVVDDGSAEPLTAAALDLPDSDAVGRVDVIRHASSLGPAAARNTGLAAGTASMVAFLDSDCVPVPGWFGTLARHLQDPKVAIVGPRIVSYEQSAIRVGAGLGANRLPSGPDHGDLGANRPPSGADDAGSVANRPASNATPAAWLVGYEQVASALDMGQTGGRVEPGLPIGYLPSAALLARRAALGNGFSTGMPVAEDVDFVWRLAAAGWTVRYEPLAQVEHEHRTRPAAFLARRAYYGTGAALLAQRHGNAVAPVVVAPWTAFAWVAVLIGRRWSLKLAGAALSIASLQLARALARAGVPSAMPVAADLVWRGSASASRALLRPPVREYWPVVALAAARWPSVRRRVVLAAILDGVLGWWPHRRTTSLWGFVAGRRLEDLAYGAGVWRGAVRARSLAALRPSIRTRRRTTTTTTTTISR